MPSRSTVKRSRRRGGSWSLPACDEGKHTRRDAAHFFHEPFQFPVVLDPLPVQAEFVFGELQADGLSARPPAPNTGANSALARPVVVRAVTRLRVVVAATGGPPTRYPAGGASSSYGHGSALLLDRPRCRDPTGASSGTHARGNWLHGPRLETRARTTRRAGIVISFPVMESRPGHWHRRLHDHSCCGVEISRPPGSERPRPERVGLSRGRPGQPEATRT